MTRTPSVMKFGIVYLCERDYGVVVQTAHGSGKYPQREWLCGYCNMINKKRPAARGHVSTEKGCICPVCRARVQ